METVETYEHRGYTIEVFQDEDAEAPHKYADEFMEFVAWHREYRFQVNGQKKYGSVQDFFDALSGIDRDALPERESEINGYEYKYRGRWHCSESIDEIARTQAFERNVILPVSLGDHSGIWLYEGHGPAPGDAAGWDSGAVGFIWASKDTFRKETGYSEGDLFGSAKRPLKVGDHVRAFVADSRSIDYDKWAWGRITRVEHGQNGQGIYTITHRGQGNKYPDYDLVRTRTGISEVMTGQAMTMLRGYLELWDSYVRGEVYGYRVLDPDGNEVDDLGTGGGYYGDPEAPCGLVADARGEIDGEIAYRERKRAEAEAAERAQHYRQLKAWIRNRVPLAARKSLEVTR